MPLAQTGTNRSAGPHYIARLHRQRSRSCFAKRYAILAKDLSSRQLEEIDSLLIVAAPTPESAQLEAECATRSPLEQFKTVARKESPESLLSLLDQLNDVRSLGLTAWPALTEIPARRLTQFRIAHHQPHGSRYPAAGGLPITVYAHCLRRL